MTRARRFTVWGRFDGARSAKITITDSPAGPLFSVRPFRRRRAYELLLADVAAWTLARVVKAELQAARATKRKPDWARVREIAARKART